jgi:hypothetical protein
LFVFQQTRPNPIPVGVVEHDGVLHQLHAGRSLAPRSTVSVVDLTSHRGDDESDEEGEHETNDAEREPGDVVVLISSEVGKALTHNELDEHRCAGDDDNDSEQ